MTGDDFIDKIPLNRCKESKNLFPFFTNRYRGGFKAIRKVFGNTHGLRSQHRKSLEKFYRRKIDPTQVITPEVARDLSRLSSTIKRQVGLLINRTGNIEQVIVGDHHSIMIPRLPKSRGAKARLRGLRYIHTHLGSEPITQDDLMDLVFLRFDLLGVVQVDAQGGPRGIEVAHLLPDNRNGRGWEIIPLRPIQDQNINFLEWVRALETEFTRKQELVPVSQGQERVILISVSNKPRAMVEESMAELAELAESNNLIVAETIIQRPRNVNPKYLMGKGKLREIIIKAMQLGVDLLIFDQELNPSQVRSITDITELRVIDRTQLILDIFAQRARSREGKIQVEMAQLKYLLPRLVKKDDALSRLTGGIGGRGPGETKLEVDRRRVRDRIARLEKELTQVKRQRAQQKRRRRRQQLPVISIVGYTNAGKSTLLNSLTKSKVHVENRLFATLDPTSKRLRFPRDFEVIITDTVGFIKDLPRDLVDAFAATLEELEDANLLLHVIDISNPNFPEQVRSVERILGDLGLTDIPTIRVLNKIDLVDEDYAKRQCEVYNGVAISAIEPSTLMPLIETMQDIIAPYVLGAKNLEKGEFLKREIPTQLS